MERVRTGQDRVVGPADRDGSVCRDWVPAGPDTPRPVDRRDRTRRALACSIHLIALRSFRSGGSAGLPRRDDVARCKPGSTPFKAIRNNGKHPLPGARPNPAAGRAAALLAKRAFNHCIGRYPVPDPGERVGSGPGRARESAGDGERGGHIERKVTRVWEAAISGRSADLEGSGSAAAWRTRPETCFPDMKADHASATIVEEYRV